MIPVAKNVKIVVVRNLEKSASRHHPQNLVIKHLDDSSGEGFAFLTAWTTNFGEIYSFAYHHNLQWATQSL